ncbi:MAG: Ppx/GppA family phosphatase [Cellulomonadaceae bacterium]|nr:Ppx/GppA family phosphatase [Cellulomonadaceae bacterium]
MSSTRVAVVDCGTNTIRLLVADVTAEGVVTDVIPRRATIVRLGQGIDETGEFAPEALERTFAATREYAATIAEVGGVERVRFIATSASRDAGNRDEFFSGIASILGVVPEVISGTREAALAFRGAVSEVRSAWPGPYCVVDLGGGSTELVVGTDTPVASFSMNVGSVRLTERCITGDPPSEEERRAVEDAVRTALDEAAATVPLGTVKTIVGLAGTITTLTGYSLGLHTYDREKVNGASFDVEQVEADALAMFSMSRQERLDLGFMQPGRADVIGAGAIVWREVVARVASEVTRAGGGAPVVVTSEHDILDGLAAALGEVGRL